MVGEVKIQLPVQIQFMRMCKRESDTRRCETKFTRFEIVTGRD